MVLEMALTERDLAAVQAVYPDNRVELCDGRIIVMSPSDHKSEVIAARLVTHLQNWVGPRDLGFVATSSAGFYLPNGDVLAPDVSYVSKRRMSISPRAYARVVPELAVEIKSPSDRVKEIQEKLAIFRSLGAEATLLVDPDEHTVRVDVNGQPEATLTDADAIELPHLLPGWSMRVSELWPKPM
jgi:Uma2 family endonuclease